MHALAEGELEVVEILGVKAPLDPEVMSPRLIELIRAGEYERGEAKRLAGMLEPGERLLELGAGVGFLSALIGIHDRTAAIVAVEANPALVPLIRRTHALNGVRSEVINAAVVGERRGPTASFTVGEDFWASSLTPRRKLAIREVVDVPTVAIADLMAEHRPTFLIMDVEGGEAEVVPHLELTGVRRALVELHHKVIGFEGVRAVFEHFHAQGFVYDTRFSNKTVIVFTRLSELL
jgi:FkbM family methyltransferase